MRYPSHQYSNPLQTRRRPSFGIMPSSIALICRACMPERYVSGSAPGGIRIVLTRGFDRERELEKSPVANHSCGVGIQH